MYPELFISYSRSDKYKILSIVRQLADLGASIWLDESDIYGASFWSAEIVDAIENCKVILLFLSHNATQSINVTKELHLGLEKSKYILPILLESIVIPRTMKYALAGIQSIDAFDRKDESIPVIALALNHLGINIRTYSNIKDTQFNNQLQSALTRLQLPPFVYSRDKVVDNISSKIISGQLPVTLIQGLSGSGKTTLACEVLKRIEKHFVLLFAYNFFGPHAHEATYFIEELNQSLQILKRSVSKQLLESLTPERALESLLIQISDVPSLFVLDNLDETDLIWQKNVIRTFSTLPKLKVLITVTSRPEGIEQTHLITITPLSKFEALEFIEKSQLLPNKISANDILNQLPVSIYSNPRFLVTLLAQLNDFSLEMLLTQGIDDIAEQTTNVIYKVLDLLSDKESDFLILMAVISEQDIQKSFDILRINIPKNIFKTLKLLITRSLLVHVNKGYAVPDMVLYVLGSNHRKKILSVAKEVTNCWCTAIQFASNQAQSLQEIANLGAAIAYALYRWRIWDQLNQLAHESNLEILNMAGIWKEYSAILSLSIKAAVAQCDINKRVLLSCRLARKHYQLDNYEGARQLIEECKLLVSENDLSILHATIQSHQIYLFDQNQYPARVLRALHKSRTIYKKLKNDSGMRTIERLIGQLYLRCKNHRNARNAYLKALKYFTANDITKEKIEIELDLALCDLETGYIKDAEQQLLVAIEHCNAIGYQAGLPRAFLILSKTLDSLARYEEALNAANQAIYYGVRLNKNVYLTALLMKSKLQLLINNR